MRFPVGNNTAGNPCWWLYSGNEMVAWAGETFASTGNAQRACLAFDGAAASCRYDIYKDEVGQYRWRAWNSSDKVASSGESFYGESNARQAAGNVRDNAGGADGPYSQMCRPTDPCYS